MLNNPIFVRTLAKQFVLIALSGIILVSNSALATEIWLSGTDPVLRRTSYKDESPSDYMQLFEDNAPWGNAAANVKAFKTTTQFVVGATDDQLTKMFTSLKKRRIAFAMETLMLPVGDNGCGNGIEGYLDPHGLQLVMDRIRRLGGDLRYVAMDEPLWFGHAANLPNACHSPIETIARDVAFRVSVIKKVFPDVEIGDIEPIATSVQPSDWLDEVTLWAETYQKAVGAPLHSFDADVTWTGPWKSQLKTLATRLRNHGVAFGIIFDGDATDPTGVAWTTHAEERFTQVESDPALIPQRAILQSWTLQPSHMLPETQPGTMTYLVDRYVARQVVLTVNRVDGRLTGHLADVSGNPVSGGQVALFAVDGGNAAVKSVRTLTGDVPATATKAIVGLRINTECGCSGPAKVDIGTINYHDGGANVALRSPLLTNNADTEFSASSGQVISRNSDIFAVAAGSHFTLEVPMGATAASSNSGYLGLIFLDANGKEVRRIRLSFQPSSKSLGTATTDSGGNFTFQPSAAVTNSDPSYRATYSGGTGYRLMSAMIQ